MMPYEPMVPKQAVPSESTPIGVVKVIYNGPATVVYWDDGTRTVVKCQPGDKFNHLTGFLLAALKRVCGNSSNYNQLLKEVVPGYGGEKIHTEPSVEQMRKELANFCHDRSCQCCPMHVDGFECGRGKYFTCDTSDRGYMTDESIILHYMAMKGAKS